MDPKTILRLEGLAVSGAATIAYFSIDAPLWLFILIALAPDLSMLGYLGGSHIGSRVYNMFHTYLGPIGIGAIGLWVGVETIYWIALVWTAHIGVDRAVGYGLKYPSGFKMTHLTRGEDSDRLITEMAG